MVSEQVEGSKEIHSPQEQVAQQTQAITEYINEIYLDNELSPEQLQVKYRDIKRRFHTAMANNVRYTSLFMETDEQIHFETTCYQLHILCDCIDYEIGLRGLEDMIAEFHNKTEFNQEEVDQFGYALSELEADMQETKLALTDLRGGRILESVEQNVRRLGFDQRLEQLHQSYRRLMTNEQSRTALLN